MGLIARVGYAVRKQLVKGKPIAECRSGHDLTETDVASGRCPVADCPTGELFPGKGPGEGER